MYVRISAGPRADRKEYSHFFAHIHVRTLYVVISRKRAHYGLSTHPLPSFVLISCTATTSKLKGHRPWALFSRHQGRALLPQCCIFQRAITDYVANEVTRLHIVETEKKFILASVWQGVTVSLLLLLYIIKLMRCFYRFN